MQDADSVYAHDRPWQTNEQRITGMALASNALMSSEQIRAIRPPLPRQGMLPPRFGYTQRVFSIQDVVRLDAMYPGARIDYSGTQSGLMSSGIPAIGTL